MAASSESQMEWDGATVCLVINLNHAVSAEEVLVLLVHRDARCSSLKLDFYLFIYFFDEVNLARPRHIPENDPNTCNTCKWCTCDSCVCQY